MALIHLPHPELATYASPSALLKARQIRDYLLRLRRGLERGIERGWPKATLFVLDEPEWRTQLRLPYGYPVARVRGERAVYVPRDLPERLEYRILEALTAARTSPPGPPHELIDLASGHEYAHVLAVGRGILAAARWADELIANGLWVLGLAQGDRAALERVARWAEVLARIPLTHPRPRNLTEELALTGRSLLACLRETDRCREVLTRILNAKLPPGRVRAMLEPWRKWLRPDGSPATPSNE